MSKTSVKYVIGITGEMELATKNDVLEIMELYTYVVETVNKSTVKLGWNTDVYPNEEFVANAVDAGQMLIVRDETNDNKIIAAAVVNHNVNEEYSLIEWEIKEPSNKISTIHALATSPDYRGGEVSSRFLGEIGDYCKANGDVSIHLDVIDTNIPAYKLYIRNGYTEVDCIKMYYEVVGTREFWMLEKVL